MDSNIKQMLADLDNLSKVANGLQSTLSNITGELLKQPITTDNKDAMELLKQVENNSGSLKDLQEKLNTLKSNGYKGS